MRAKTKILLAVIVTAILTGGLATLITFKIHKHIKAKYDATIADYQARCDSLGTIVTCYTVKNQVDPGTEITEDLLQEQSTSEYFINSNYVLDKNNLIGKLCKIALTPGTPITQDMLMTEIIEDTLRDTDIIAGKYPAGTKVGDYLDLRITYPYGEDYLGISHIRVESLNDTTIKVYLDENQLLTYQAMLVDWYLTKDTGTSLYLTKYVEPGLQRAAQTYYTVPTNVANIMKEDPNAVEEAMSSAKALKRSTLEKQRDAAKSSLFKTGEDAATKEELAKEDAEHLKDYREKEEAAVAHGIQYYANPLTVDTDGDGIPDAVASPSPSPDTDTSTSVPEQTPEVVASEG